MRSRFPHRIASACLLAVALPALAAPTLRDETAEHQARQQVLQESINAADDETKALLLHLRDARETAKRLESYNAELAPLVRDQQSRIERQRHALDTLDATREALPGTMRQMVERLRAIVEADLPFRHEQRMARVESLETMLADASLSSADKLERILSAWQMELDYGQKMEAWRDTLVGSDDTEVQYLRMGRMGFYYMTPDGRQGGVWNAAQHTWQPIDGEVLEAVRNGVKIAADQRSPELLSLPLSVEVQRGDQPSQDVNDSERNPQEASS
ncbi:DUF3450 domain-containing protein [Phytohalomonas tamaricis]|uniref:DUF3450 domain-containing protein n=1 Tax=Phytohalomonas tamaricis TaxID=2081032 RepID=UPI0021D45D2B|nr:DUF3450 domain-containing protein [Phytohalomonas tamaricis]